MTLSNEGPAQLYLVAEPADSKQTNALNCYFAGSSPLTRSRSGHSFSRDLALMRVMIDLVINSWPARSAEPLGSYL